MSAARFGHDCVGALLVRGDEVLLGRRADDRAWLPGAWDLFGGHVEAGEDAERALRRELREELGIEAAALRPLGVLASDEAGWRLQVFAVDRWQGVPANRQPGEHAELRWMARADAQARLAAAHPGFTKLIAKAFASPPGQAPTR